MKLLVDPCSPPGEGELWMQVFWGALRGAWHTAFRGSAGVAPASGVNNRVKYVEKQVLFC